MRDFSRLCDVLKAVTAMREWADRLPEEIPDGAKLLNDVHAFLGRFVAYPSEAAQSHTRYGSRTRT